MEELFKAIGELLLHCMVVIILIINICLIIKSFHRYNLWVKLVMLFIVIFLFLILLVTGHYATLTLFNIFN